MACISEHPLYSKTVSNLERTAVRDKIVRVIQYFSKFAAFYAFRKGYSRNVYSKFIIISKQLSLSRKVFRVAKPMAAFKSFMKEWNNQTSDRVVHNTTLLRQLGYGGYLVLDIFLWAQAVGVLNLDKAGAKRLGENANRLWLLSILSQLTAAAYAYYRADQRKRALKSQKETDAGILKRADAELQAAATLVAWQLFDVVIPLKNLEFISWNDGLIGVFGTISSVIGLRSIW